MHKRGLCRYAVCVCLSVRPSVTFVDSVETNKHIFNFFTILVFRTSWQHSDGNPPNRGVECRWGRHNSRFLTNISLSDWWLVECEQQLRRSIVQFAVTAQTATHRWIFNCVLSQPAWTTTMKRRERQWEIGYRTGWNRHTPKINLSSMLTL